MQCGSYIHSHYRTIDSMGNVEETCIMQIYVGWFCANTTSEYMGICVPVRVSYSHRGVRSEECLFHINPKWRYVILSLQNPVNGVKKIKWRTIEEDNQC